MYASNQDLKQAGNSWAQKAGKDASTQQEAAQVLGPFLSRKARAARRGKVGWGGEGGGGTLLYLHPPLCAWFPGCQAGSLLSPSRIVNSLMTGPPPWPTSKQGQAQVWVWSSKGRNGGKEGGRKPPGTEHLLCAKYSTGTDVSCNTTALWGTLTTPILQMWKQSLRKICSWRHG